ncbi:hypothetical protein DI09_167p20 [Mitosporidium daphniae]|uniref:Uncharacterized protein n=1 Tax=Mitosporidium daphniae TaxID=1485682 RepID=A0A098VTR7_9MICR|nr:uncharacterized protein DI09_167p20 [Mitosporidium daphniae]KGG52498.1 hypothetical protein DI09_167p20 [Mitosporidium daphniae]|eukprot:XP_013238934.1 uncharacterized protein DI09_167p20 [Mitosporidium daphniae]
MMVSQSQTRFPGGSEPPDCLQIRDLILGTFNESLVAIPENSEIDKQLLTLDEHEAKEELHSNWIKVKEKYAELGILYSPDKGQKRCMGFGSSKGSK